jgi:hypothetical protein
VAAVGLGLQQGRGLERGEVWQVQEGRPGTMVKVVMLVNRTVNSRSSCRLGYTQVTSPTPMSCKLAREECGNGAKNQEGMPTREKEAMGAVLGL